MRLILQVTSIFNLKKECVARCHVHKHIHCLLFSCQTFWGIFFIQINIIVCWQQKKKLKRYLHTTFIYKVEEKKFSSQVPYFLCDCVLNKKEVHYINSKSKSFKKLFPLFFHRCCVTTVSSNIFSIRISRKKYITLA